MPIASQMPLQNSEQHVALNNLPLHNSHFINKFAASALQQSDDKEWEQFEQLEPIKRKSDTNTNNYHKFLKLGAKVQN